MPSAPAGKSVSDLDPNFKPLPEPDGLRWVDARELTLEGLGWVEESAPYCRFPDRAKGVIRDPVWEGSRFSAGVCVRFVSDTNAVSARWRLRSEHLAMPHMPATGVSGLDLYVRDADGDGCCRWAGVARAEQFPENRMAMLGAADSRPREFTLYLPLYNGVEALQIGIAEGASLERVTRSAKPPLCFYGTSIVQGGCASRPGMAYPAILGRRLDWPHWNFGFSGNGQAEPETAALLAELDPVAFVLDPLPNLTPGDVRERMCKFVEILHAARPQTPIVLVESITYQQAWVSGLTRGEESNPALRQAFTDLGGNRAGYLTLVEGASLLGADGEGTVDGTHPTDVGFVRMAEAIAPALARLLPG